MLPRFWLAWCHHPSFPALFPYPFASTTSAFLVFSQVAEVHAHWHSDFGDNFRCHLRSSQPLARGFCKCPLHCHVILLPEAPGQPGVANVSVQNGVQPAVYLRNATEQSCLFPCIVFLQGEVQLRHGKAPLLEVWVILIAYCQIFCIIFQKLLGQNIHFEPGLDLPVCRVCWVHEILPELQHGLC